MDLDTSDLDAQIAALQAAKAAKVAQAARLQREKEKEEAKVLVGSTPTKASTIRKTDAAPLPERPAQPNFSSASAESSARPKFRESAWDRKRLGDRARAAVAQVLPDIPAPAPTRKSGMFSSLAALRRSNSSLSQSLSSSGEREPSTRSTSLSQRPTQAPGKQSVKGKEKDKGKEKEKEPTRDEDSLTVIERLELGPREFGKDPEGEEEWRNLEPNSGIRLSKRVLPHSSVQDHMYGRYYIPPSQLYSIIRMSRDGTTYDVPVEGDWITVAVVAQRGEVRVSGTKDGAVGGSDDDDDDDELGKNDGSSGLLDDKPSAADGPSKMTGKSKKTSTKKKEQKQRVPRKYINFTLCSLPPRHTKLGSGSGPTGDALLQLLMFEADAVVREKDEDGEEVKKYRGGSGGAFERWANLTEGSVVAILNPRVWRNLKGGSSGPHPLEFPLGLNPTSGDAIALIGHSRDLGCCSAIQKDGNRCKTWVDLRQGQVCEYHVHAAVQRGRAGRAEFTASTSSFALSRGKNINMGKGTTPYNPHAHANNGLLPRSGAQPAPRGQDNGGGGATYVIGGGVINTSSSSLGGLKGMGDEFLSEKLGRNRANKRKRREEEKEAERVLGRLLERDGTGGSTGGKYLALLEKQKEKELAKGKGKEKGKGEGDSKEEHGSGLGENEARASGEGRKRPFSATAIKRIGFDPTARAGTRDSEDIQKRLESIAALNGASGPGSRLERLSKRLQEEEEAAWAQAEAQAKAKAKAEIVHASRGNAAACAGQTEVDEDKQGSDGEEMMIDLD